MQKTTWAVRPSNDDGLCYPRLGELLRLAFTWFDALQITNFGALNTVPPTPKWALFLPIPRTKEEERRQKTMAPSPGWVEKCKKPTLPAHKTQRVTTTGPLTFWA